MEQSKITEMSKIESIDEDSKEAERKLNEEENKDLQQNIQKVIKYNGITLKLLEKGINNGCVYIGKLI